jgi:hypothetical protein
MVNKLFKIKALAAVGTAANNRAGELGPLGQAINSDPNGGVPLPAVNH